MPKKNHTSGAGAFIITIFVLLAFIGFVKHQSHSIESDRIAATEQTSSESSDKSNAEAMPTAPAEEAEAEEAEEASEPQQPLSTEVGSKADCIFMPEYERVGLPQVASGTAEELLYRGAYVDSWNPDNRIPNWVMWLIRNGNTDGPYKRKGIEFQEDLDATNSPTTYDYVRSGYDRGHMCPSGDNRWDAEAQRQSFLMTNICPQEHSLNAGDWSELENRCRDWANRYGEVFVIAGPILFRQQHRHIGHGRRKIVVPEAFFKVVYIPSEHAASGFIYRNDEGNRPMGDYQNTLSQTERITGMKFFPNVDHSTLTMIRL